MPRKIGEPRQVPLIVRSPLTDRWHCVTKYRHDGRGRIVATEKADVHDQTERIIADAKEDADGEQG